MVLHLSKEQELFVRKLIVQDPCQVDGLAAVLWDSISYTGLNDASNLFGIHFTKGPNAEVIVWEKDSSIKLPRQAFLEVLELTANYTLRDAVNKNKDVSKLRRALKNLREEISHLKSFGDSLQYCFATENSFDNADESIKAIEGSRFAWLEGLKDISEDHHVSTRRTEMPAKPQPLRGVEGALVGRTPYQTGKDGLFSTTIKSKLKAINIFRTILGKEDCTEEDVTLPEHM